jgi:hypothetical protein
MTVDRPVSRRSVLVAGVAGLGSAVVARVAGALPVVERLSHRAPGRLPEIQHDIGDFLAPVRTIDGVRFRFGPTYTQFAPMRLLRAPTLADRDALSDALATIEDTYEFAPEGVFVFVSYGVPYFRALPRAIVAEHMPRLVDDPRRPALEEAEPGPTDVSFANRDVRKQRFEVPVRIESNDVLLTIRSDELDITRDVLGWLRGSGDLGGRPVPSPRIDALLEVQQPRLMFVRPGIPRGIADEANLPYAGRIHPDSPMWMGFADQQVDASGPAAITTFAGNTSARLTTARPGDYFADGAVQHLSHVILDLEQFYLGSGGGGSEDAEEGEEAHGKEHADEEEDEEEDEDATYLERVQYMFRSTPPPHEGYDDQVTDGGGPAYLPNEFQGADDAERAARGEGTPEGEHRIGHVSALQRSSRAADGTPIHQRVDGPGYDAMDVPGGSPEPKLQFSVFVPSARFFADVRRNQASVDLARRHRVPADDHGLERFITATRRQNFLVPPRSARAFPLLEEASDRAGA